MDLAITDDQRTVVDTLRKACQRERIAPRFPVSRFFRGTRCDSRGDRTTETLRNRVSRNRVNHRDLTRGVTGLGDL